MNNKVKAERHRKLPITSLATGILGFGIAYLLFFIVGPSVGFGNFIPEEFIIIFVMSFLVICLPVPAIVCGSIDLKRIKRGQYSSKGKGFDITGLVLGSIVFLMVAFEFGEVILPNIMFFI
jgi:hypothetical protein